MDLRNITTQHYNPEDLNLKHHCCETLKTCMIIQVMVTKKQKLFLLVLVFPDLLAYYNVCLFYL